MNFAALRRRSVFGAALLASAVTCSAAVPAETIVRFDRIQGHLTKPDGAGPFPAVVIMHSCLGLPAARKPVGALFASWGYAALFVDEFSTRGLKETCARDFSEGVTDALGALAFLAKRPDVDAKRIGVIGYSQGADTALQLASARFGSAFKAAAAFYPPCANREGARMEIPTLVLIGAADEVTPAADCQELAKNQPADFKLVVYPGAHHLFDDPALAGGKRVLGMWLQYDARAAGQSKAELRDFLAARLLR